MSMQILKDFDLTELNTFGIPARAKFFTELSNESDFAELFTSLEFRNNEKLFLGGGSNVLFTRDFDGIVILNKLQGIEILEETENSVLVRAMAGVVWHDLVLYAVERGLWGIENLSLIPGTVGAAPMQNIGAYGAELRQTLKSVEAYDIETGEKRIFENEECNLGYRDSVFKQELKGKYFISAITLRLNKIEKKNLSYKILQNYLDENKIEVKSVKDISNAISAIRRSKLPDPKVIGNAGSFFKNVFVTKEELSKLQEKYPEMPFFEEPAPSNNGSSKEEQIKIPAGWLIEACGWKGKRVGNTGVHDKQALVLVNHGGATGPEIKNLAFEIIASVEQKFGLKLVPEVNLI